MATAHSGIARAQSGDGQRRATAAGQGVCARGHYTHPDDHSKEQYTTQASHVTLFENRLANFSRVDIHQSSAIYNVREGGKSPLHKADFLRRCFTHAVSLAYMTAAAKVEQLRVGDFLGQ